MFFLFEILLYIILGIVIYIITDKFSYIVNVVIYAVMMTVILLFVSKMTFGIFMLQLICNIIIGLIVIGIAQKLRDGFDYDTIIGFIIIVSITQMIVTEICRGIISLF